MKKQGSALILTLLVVATLTGLTVAFSEESSLELNLAGYSRDGDQAYLAARSGVHLALALLNADENKEVDSLEEDWGQFGSEELAIEFPNDVATSGRIVDENGKLNVNLMFTESGDIDEKKEQEVTRLFDVLGLPENAVASLLDWLDKDNVERLEGAESFYYQNLDIPYGCANAPFLTPGQLLLVKGMKDLERFGENRSRKLLDFLTINSGGKININTASPEVLQCLSGGIDTALAESIIERRKEQAFSEIGELDVFLGIDNTIFNEIRDRITVKSSAFSIEVQGRYQEAVAEIRADVLRNGDGVKLISWRVQ